MSPPDQPTFSTGEAGNTSHEKPNVTTQKQAVVLKAEMETGASGAKDGASFGGTIGKAFEPGPEYIEEDLIDLSTTSPSTSNHPAETGDDPQRVTESQGDSASTEEPPDLMTSSVATLKPGNLLPSNVSDRHLSVIPKSYVDTTPPTPLPSRPPSRTPSTAASRSRHSAHSSEPSPTRSDAGYDDGRYTSEEEKEGGSRSEIQSIMEQFGEEGGGPGADEVMSPRLEIASPLLGASSHHPPRRSSLDPLATGILDPTRDFQGLRLSSASSASAGVRDADSEDSRPPVPPKDGPGAMNLPNRSLEERHLGADSPMTPTMSLHRPPPPEADPEPSLPFDFHRFLEQLRNKKADPVARYLQSFLKEFGKRQWMVHEQVKIISDFLAFIGNKMAQCDVWRTVSDAEFDNAREGMEKLVMNRLYAQTFSPAIPPPQPIPGAKTRRRGAERPLGPGRRGQHQEDVERDDVLTQKINIYGWVKEEHLDIPPVSDSGRRFLRLAQQELLKIKTYRAPRDKIICVLNCCKVIFGLLKHAKSDSSADSFMPLLIYVVLQSNPEHLVSNVQYILRFRNQDKLGGEAGYYLSSLMGVIQFIENMDRTTLTITDDEFERNVEAAVSAIAEKHRIDPPSLPPKAISEKAAASLQLPGESSTPRRSLETKAVETSTPRRSTSSEGGGDSAADEKAAMTGLLRSIQRPLSSIGRMFSDEQGDSSGTSGAPRTVGDTQQRSPRPSSERRRDEPDRPTSRHKLTVEEAAARQASAEVAEAQRLHRAEHDNIVETLAGMFPDLDREIISDVVYQKEGRVGLAVDACLALST